MQHLFHQDIWKLVQVLKISAFRYLWFAQFISQVTVNMLVFALGLMIYQRTKTNTFVSLLYIVVGLPAAFFGAIFGVFVDGLNKKKVLVISTLSRALIVGLMAVFKTNLILIYLLAAVSSMVSQFFVPAQAALIPEYVTKKLLLSANALFTLVLYGSLISGFLLAGPMLQFWAEDKFLLMCTGLFIIAALFLVFLPRGYRQIYSGSRVFWKQFQQEFNQGIKFITSQNRVFSAILLLTLSQAIVVTFATLAPGFADKVLEVKVTDVSVIIIAPAVLGMILGALVLGQIGARFSKRNLIRAGIFLSGIVLISVSLVIKVGQSRQISFQPSLALDGVEKTFLSMTVLAFWLLGIALSLIEVTCNTVIQEDTPEPIRGRVYGVLASLISGVALLPVLVSGILADFLGIKPIIFLLGFLLLGLGLLTTNLPNLVIRVFKI